MGQRSAARSGYYLFLSVFYIIVAILPLTTMDKTTECPVLCPLRYSERVWLNWECGGTRVTSYESEADYKNYYNLYYQELQNSSACFICQAANLTGLIVPCQPCRQYWSTVDPTFGAGESRDQFFSTSSLCEQNTNFISDCTEATIPNYKPAEVALADEKLLTIDNVQQQVAFAPEADIYLRGAVPMQLLIIAIVYLVQAVGCLFTGLALCRMKDYNGDAWLEVRWCDRLCFGPCVRIFPMINRILNLAVLFVIINLVNIIWINQTCYDALDQYSERTLYPLLSGWLGFVCAQYVALCGIGNIVRASILSDVAFREPLPVLNQSQTLTCCGNPCCTAERGRECNLGWQRMKNRIKRLLEQYGGP